MKQNFDEDMLYDDTTSKNQIVTPEQFQKGELEDRERIEEEDALVEIESTRTQVMEIEDFVHMLKNKAISIDNIDERIEGIEEGIESYEDAYGDEMEMLEILDKEKKSETTREPVPANSLTYNHMEAYKKLEQERQQIRELEDQREMVIGQIKDLWPVAKELFEEGQPVPREVHRLDFLDTSQFVENEEDVEEPAQEQIETEEKRDKE